MPREAGKKEKKVKTLNALNAYNSKTRVHKLIKLCILRAGNKVYSMIESSLQLTLTC